MRWKRPRLVFKALMLTTKILTQEYQMKEEGSRLRLKLRDNQKLQMKPNITRKEVTMRHLNRLQRSNQKRRTRMVISQLWLRSLKSMTQWCRSQRWHRTLSLMYNRPHKPIKIQRKSWSDVRSKSPLISQLRLRQWRQITQRSQILLDLML